MLRRRVDMAAHFERSKEQYCYSEALIALAERERKAVEFICLSWLC